MKRTKRMILATMVATVAIAVSLMSTAFAAPAKTCPLKAKAIAAAPAKKACPKADLASKLLGANVNPADITTSKCPKADAIKQMLEKLGCKLPATLPATVANGNCMKDGNCVIAACKEACGGNCTMANCLTKNCMTGNCTTPDCQR